MVWLILFVDFFLFIIKSSEKLRKAQNMIKFLKRQDLTVYNFFFPRDKISTEAGLNKSYRASNLSYQCDFGSSAVQNWVEMRNILLLSGKICRNARFNLLSSFCGSRNVSGLSYRHNPGSEPFMYQNVGQTLQNTAEKHPDREALVSCQEKTRLTFAEALRKVNA